MPQAEAASKSSLVARVAIGTAVSAATAALVAATVSLLIADRLVLDGEDRRLRSTAALVMRELPKDGDDVALKRAVEEEVIELAPESIRIAVVDGNGRKLVGGDAQLPRLEPGACASRDTPGFTLRACAVQAGNVYVVAGAARAPHGLTAILLSCLVAAAVAALGAAFASRRAARWALEPLTRLRDSLDRIAVDDPKTAVIAGDDTCREVATLRAALGSLVARLAESLDSARRFSADAAHELKTPLTVISAELDLLAEEPLDAASATAVEKLRARVASLGKLVERLLALATAADRARLTTEAVALEDIARDVVERLGPSARARVRLRADAPGMVLGDELLLAALVENAVDNALKFSGDGPVDVHVAEPDGIVVLDVTDDGPGIPPADRARAFEPFFRTPASRGANTPGHGVGLALVAQIASAHDGAAEFVDVPPSEGRTRQGARLRVTLPVWSARL